MTPNRLMYNIPGVIASGLKTPRSFEKLQGTRTCGCGRTISANKIRCATCQDSIEAAFAVWRDKTQPTPELAGVIA